jgi:hypothetical protein
MRNSLLVAVLFLAVLVVLGGCPATSDVFDDYLERSDPLRVAPVAGECSGPLDLSGRYLVGAAIVIGPDKPLRFLAEVGVEGTSIAMTLQPLAFAGNAANLPAGTPVGEVFEASGELDPVDGSFSLDFGSVVVPGTANAILANVEVTAAFVMEGCTSTASFACGAVSGDTMLPVALPLAGSTWAIAPWPEGLGFEEVALEVECPRPEP